MKIGQYITMPNFIKGSLLHVVFDFVLYHPSRRMARVPFSPSLLEINSDDLNSVGLTKQIESGHQRCKRQLAIV